MKRAIFFITTFLASIVLAASVVRPSRTVQSAPPNFYKSVIIGTGLNQPITMEFAPDGRLFILERTGNVRIYKNGSLLSTPFVVLPAATNGDRGLIGLAFDPDFNQNHYLYFYYAGSDNYNYLVRLDASGDIAIDNPTVLYQTTTPSERLHVGGTLAFGPDGMLYLAIGDNGYPPNAQDKTTPFGKILRLNRDGTIPADNPFYNEEGSQKAIFAYGLRNPWRFQFDTLTGEMILGDVGEDTWEEINIIEKGKNYGWPIAEGICNCGFEDPIYAYPHQGPSSAVTAGPVYSGTMFPPEYSGDFFYGDYGQGFIKGIDLSTREVYDFDANAGTVVDLKQAQDGSLYVLTIFPGQLFRYSYSDGNQPPAVFATADTDNGPEPLTVTFNSGGTFDPESNALTYLWDFGDGTTSTLQNPSKTYTLRGDYIVVLTVSDGSTDVLSLPLTIQVGITPTVTIAFPTEGTTYRAGDTITYEAYATDYQGNSLSNSAFITEVYHHRGSHVHPHEGPLEGVSAGSFYIPTFGKADPDQWYEIKITAIDADGLRSTVSRRIDPELSSYTIAATAQNALATIDGTPWLTPKEVLGLIGFEQELSVPFIQVIDNTLYRFTQWSQGGTRTQTVAMPEAPITFTAELTPTSHYLAQYFDNMTLSGQPILTQDEVDINYLWKYGPPQEGVPQENFSVRWSKLEQFSEGVYEFTLTTDDGMRVLLDGKIVYDAWYDQSPTEHSFSLPISAGSHNLSVEYYENQWEARAQFEYQRVGDVPSLPQNQYRLEMWNYEGWSSPLMPTTQPVINEFADTINNNWGQNVPRAGINQDKFIARWSKEIELTAGTYKFESLSDDGIRVYLNGDTIIDQWNDHGAKAYGAELNLPEGTYSLIIEYYENGWDAVAIFDYYKVIASGPPPEGIYRAEYWNTPVATIPARTADYIEEIPQINFNWGQGRPASGIGEDRFAVRLASIQTFEPANYLIKSTTDDGVRVFVDGELVIDNWTDHGATVDTVTRVLSGEHEIIMEYYENGWDAVAKLEFTIQ